MDCLPRSSHTPPVLVPPRPRESSPPWCLSLPLLLVWMYVSFLSTWCRTSLPLDFLSVLVVRGGAVCLPRPPSWFSTPVILLIPYTSPTPFFPSPSPLNTLHVISISVMSVATSFISAFIYLGLLSFFVMSLVKCSSILFTFSKNELLA